MTSPITTLFPVASLPACISQCGVLYDVNGACVPPAAATADVSVYESCFCGNAKLTALKTTTTDFCNGHCVSTDLAIIEGWYSNYCKSVDGKAGSTTGAGSSSIGSSSNNTSVVGGTWISTHWQWVIFLAIMVVAIGGGWIGAYIWRKHYLAKKDRKSALGRHLARETESGRIVPNSTSAGSIHVPAPGMFQAAPISSADDYTGISEKPKKEKKKWIVKERT